MTKRRADVQLPSDELLIDGEQRNPGLTWPLGVDRWLEIKLEEARRAGMATSRKELAAALMTASEPDEDQLVDILRRYRRRSIADLLPVDEGTNVVTFRKHGPGPRTQRSV